MFSGTMVKEMGMKIHLETQVNGDLYWQRKLLMSYRFQLLFSIVQMGVNLYHFSKGLQIISHLPHQTMADYITG